MVNDNVADCDDGNAYNDVCFVHDGDFCKVRKVGILEK